MFHSKLINFITITILIFGLACSNSDSSKPTSKPQGRTITPESELFFLDTDGSIVSSIEIAIADEQMERNQGLMDVGQMGFDEGMLFIFDESRPLSFWMANTPLSLDIMYVNTDSVIVRIYPDTTPFSETSLPSGESSLYVVETNAGYALKNGITEGMKIRF